MAMPPTAIPLIIDLSMCMSFRSRHFHRREEQLAAVCALSTTKKGS
jgi:hypothetical protein